MVWNERDIEQLAYLQTPAGGRDSGRVRYAAAMHFHARHLLSAEALEVYRMLAKEDGTEPRPVLARRGLAAELDHLMRGPATA